MGEIPPKKSIVLGTVVLSPSTGYGLRSDQQTGDVYHRERRQIMPGLGGRTGEGGGVFVWVVCVVARIGQSVRGALA